MQSTSNEPEIRKWGNTTKIASSYYERLEIIAEWQPSVALSNIKLYAIEERKEHIGSRRVGSGRDIAPGGLK